MAICDYSDSDILQPTYNSSLLEPIVRNHIQSSSILSTWLHHFLTVRLEPWTVDPAEFMVSLVYKFMPDMTD